MEYTYADIESEDEDDKILRMTINTKSLSLSREDTEETEDEKKESARRLKEIQDDVVENNLNHYAVCGKCKKFTICLCVSFPNQEPKRLCESCIGLVFDDIRDL